jgi:hypothetical protein
MKNANLKMKYKDRVGKNGMVEEWNDGGGTQVGSFGKPFHYSNIPFFHSS